MTVSARCGGRVVAPGTDGGLQRGRICHGVRALGTDGSGTAGEHVGGGSGLGNVPAEGLVEGGSIVEHTFESRGAGDCEKADMCLCAFMDRNVEKAGIRGQGNV